MITIDYLCRFPDLLEKCAQWNYETWGSITGKGLEDYRKTYESNMNDARLPITVIALDQNQPIGMASLCAKDGCYTYSPFPDATPWLVGLYVEPDRRRQGIGEKLIDFLKEAAQRLGYSYMFLLAYDPGLPRWYERLGWSYFGEDTLDRHPMILMKIDLSRTSR